MTKKLLVAIVFILLSVSAQAQHHEHSEHGFILLGSKQLHAYHLAKFNSPHQYQVVFELRLQDLIGREVDIAEIKKVTKANVLSLLSEDKFLITDLIASRPVSEFNVKLFSGYLRDRSTRKLLLDKLKLKIVKVNYFKELALNAPQLLRKKLIVACDRKTNEFFTAHLVQGEHNSHLQAGNFEEIAVTEPFFMGWAEEEGTIVYHCEEKFQGQVLTMGDHLDAPFTATSKLEGSFSINPGFVYFGIKNVLVLDKQSINPH